MATPEETTPETIDQTRTRAVKIIQILQKTYPQAKCALLFGDVHQLLVATILSAQCTDERVNLTTPLLFEKYQNIEAFASADVKELEKEVFSTGFYVNKAKAIKESAKQIIEKFGGEIPKSIAELTTLAGVGRKTASVVLGVGYGIAEGIVVDTHVGRISRLLGFTRKNDPAKIEKDLMEIIPVEEWILYSHLLIFHGRAICKARRPECPICPLNKDCPSAFIAMRGISSES